MDEDMEKAFNEILEQVNEQAEKFKAGLKISEEKKEEIPVEEPKKEVVEEAPKEEQADKAEGVFYVDATKDNTPVIQEKPIELSVPDLNAISLKKPILSEKTEEELYIPPKKAEEQTDGDLKIPSFGPKPVMPNPDNQVYNDKGKYYPSYGEPELTIPPKSSNTPKSSGPDIPSFEPELQIPDVKKLKAKSVGETVIPKKGTKKQMPSELAEKKKKVIKKIVIAIVSLAMAGLLTISAAHSIPVHTYRSQVDALENFVSYTDQEGKSPEATRPGEVGAEIGFAIANELIIHCIMEKDEEYDVNKAFVKYLAVAFDRISKTIPYTEHGSVNKGLYENNRHWMESIYESAAITLRSRGVMNLPEKFDDYLKANGFYNGKIRYNSLDNSLSKAPDNKVSNVEAVKNLSAYGNYLIGRVPNPEKAISKEFYEKLSQIVEYFFDYRIVYDKDGVHIKDEEGNDLYVSESLDPIIMMKEAEGEAHGRN